MNATHQNREVWDVVRWRLATRAESHGVRIPRGGVPHPRDAGARPTSTWPVGQLADYALDSPTGDAPLVIREFRDEWEVFIDGAQFVNDVAAEAEANPTGAMYLGAAMLGGAIGSSLTNKREGALLGAGLGMLLAALLDSSTPEPRERKR
ncbi:MAG: hypothetical protein EPO40_17570 [Myxococcaceae bacterium]|nr:MAG: hypothetical protein EPO40_17570 [Myxococcaceae bacterium]